jgi:hypothetical protein
MAWAVRWMGRRGAKNERPETEDLFGGEGGIRTLGGALGHLNRLAGGPIRPLWHLPGCIGQVSSIVPHPLRDPFAANALYEGSSNAGESVTVPAAATSAPGFSSSAMKTSSRMGWAKRNPQVEAGRNPNLG